MTRSYLRRAWRCRPLWFAAMLQRYGIRWSSHHTHGVLEWRRSEPGYVFGLPLIGLVDPARAHRAIQPFDGEEPSDGDSD